MTTSISPGPPGPWTAMSLTWRTCASLPGGRCASCGAARGARPFRGFFVEDLFRFSFPGPLINRWAPEKGV